MASTIHSTTLSNLAPHKVQDDRLKCPILKVGFLSVSKNMKKQIELFQKICNYVMLIIWSIFLNKLYLSGPYTFECSDLWDNARLQIKQLILNNRDRN